MFRPLPPPLLFFFTLPAPTDLYTLSLHDALPISEARHRARLGLGTGRTLSRQTGLRQSRRRHVAIRSVLSPARDRKSTRLNSSHANNSYAVFCLKKKSKRLRG